MDRRTFLRGAGAAAALSTTGLAGCGASLGVNEYHTHLRNATGSPIIGEQDLERRIASNDPSNFSKYDERLMDPSLSFTHPYKHYIRGGLNERELADMRIGVDTRTRNVYVFNDHGEIVFRAPTILGGQGRDLNGHYFTSTFSGPGVLWAPSNRPGVIIDDNVFGDLWVPMQNYGINGRAVPAQEFSGGWAPEGYDSYAIHGTNNNEAFESAQTFRETRSLGCSRLYKDAVVDFRHILELASPNRFNISHTARGKNPRGETIALNRIIPVTFRRDLV